MSSIESDLNNRRDSSTSIPKYYPTTNRSQSDHQNGMTPSSSPTDSHCAHPHPTEHTPLLDPDDPAVSPLNLQSVRILHAILWLLLAASILWFLTLLISFFLALVPTRDSGFVEFGLAGITCLQLTLALLFFKTPAPADRTANSIAAVAIAIALILALAVPGLRRNTHYTGTLALTWSLVCALVAGVLTPYMVQWGKTHEEIRLTGRRETRRTVSEWFRVWFSVLLTSLLIVIPLILYTATQLLDAHDALVLARDKSLGHYVSIYPKTTSSSALGSGYLHPVTKGSGFHYRVFVYCTPRQTASDPSTAPPSVRPGPDGRPAPIVLVEAASSVSAQTQVQGWLDELYTQTKISQVCYWNRPGRGYSDNAPSPFAPGMAADALTAALAHVLRPTDVHSPDVPLGKNLTFAVVGHGLGGLYARAFAARNLQNIHSLTLLDAYPDTLLAHRLALPGAGLRAWLQGLWSTLGLRKQASWLLHARGARDRVLGRAAHFTQPSELKASLQEQLAAVGLSRSDLDAASRILSGSNVPLAVLSSAQHIREDDEWSNYQRSLTKVTANNVAWDILEAPHELWLTPGAKSKMQRVLINLLEDRSQTP
ncbi:uncharacterized protein SAPINGB_P006058 [Magnusiomyces paraingens]|uniref:AB hydrolase-1 domain-containing protein n=1 Tax=Magnusiomyces paraingens TaxID=2606893 RepID=A0A5E8C476_9ASCO|nr:uncharacterized protein SAPINGB_P006058 [Saprochaete ingens]VVT58142.1 unnamed protein product [Saprochaete ingens]